MTDDASFLQKLGKYAVSDSIPAQAVKSFWSGLTLPGDVYAGKARPDDIGRALDFAGAITLGAGAVPAGANELRSGIKAYHGTGSDITQFDVKRGRWGPTPVFGAVDDGTPSALNYANTYRFNRDTGLPGGNIYELDINPDKILNASTENGRAALVKALDDVYTPGGESWLWEKNVAAGELPGWGDDLLFRATDNAGYSGVMLKERPKINSVAITDASAINKFRKLAEDEFMDAVRKGGAI